MSALFMSVLPSSFLIAVSFGFHFLLTFLISLYISLVLPSPWYLSMSLHWSSNHLALSFLAAFRTLLLFVLYVLSSSSEISLLFFSFLFLVYQSHGFLCDPFLFDLFLQRYHLFYRL